jgi:hypothetical protein
MKHALAFALLLLVACKNDKPAHDDKDDIAKATLTAKKIAFEGYPTWSVQHPEKACPDRIDDLLSFSNLTDAKDPWGGSFSIKCGPDLPKGAKGLAAMSPGPDGKDGTADDIKSWE